MRPLSSVSVTSVQLVQSVSSTCLFTGSAEDARIMAEREAEMIKKADVPAVFIVFLMKVK
jgi:hypothetical protein